MPKDSKRYLITAEVADLRSAPCWLPQDHSRQEARLTQLLEGERLHLLQQDGEWLFVEALLQPCYTTHWHPYRGWIHQSEAKEVADFPPLHSVGISPERFGCFSAKQTRKLPISFNREQLVADAQTLLGYPYRWGGLQGTGLDCSGLVHLLYRAQGIPLPRDAHDQWRVCCSLDKSELLPGDLIFFSKNERKTHVVIYLDRETFIEAPETGKNVRIIHDFAHKQDHIPCYGRPPLG